MSEPITLMSCPFCGSDHLTSMQVSYIKCLICGCRGPECTTLEGALRSWNVRPALATADGEAKS